MAAYTVNTTAKRETALDWFVAKLNAQRAAAGEQPVTNAQAIQVLLNGVFDSYIQQMDAEDTPTLREAYEAATPAQRAAAKAALGL